jgi:hypothetical protein
MDETQDSNRSYNNSPEPIPSRKSSKIPHPPKQLPRFRLERSCCQCLIYCGSFNIQEAYEIGKALNCLTSCERFKHDDHRETKYCSSILRQRYTISRAPTSCEFQHSRKEKQYSNYRPQHHARYIRLRNERNHRKSHNLPSSESTNEQVVLSLKALILIYITIRTYTELYLRNTLLVCLLGW